MKNLVRLVLTESLLGSPFVPQKKCNPLAVPLIEAGGAVLSGLVGGLFGSSSQSSANATNLEITRMNNEVQKQLAREANEQSMQIFNRNMDWLREQYYDTDKVRRDVQAYKAAGLNPYALAGNTATSVGSVGSPGMPDIKVPNTEAGHVEPFFLDTEPFQQAFTQGIDAYFQNQLIGSQSENVQADTQQKQIDNATRMMENISRIRLTMAEGDKMLIDKDVSEETKKSIRLQNKYLRKQIKVFSKQMSALASQPYKQNDVLDSQFEANMSQAAVNYMEMRAKQVGIELTQAQIYSVYESVKQAWQSVNNDSRLVNATEKEKAQAVISMVNRDAAEFESIGINRDLVGSQKWRNYITGAVEGLATGVGAYVGFRGLKGPKAVKGFR